MSRYFRIEPHGRNPDDIIKPGNFGEIIRQNGARHPLYLRETVYEIYRGQFFPDRPSRLNCLFCFLTAEEADACRQHIQGFKDHILHEVESYEPAVFIADMNNGLCGPNPPFDPAMLRYYWSGWQKSPDPKAMILREVLLRGGATVIQQIL